MRTLVDLLNTEYGYARIFYEQDSYGYQLQAYQQAAMTDLFERMDGFASVAEASEAARQQLIAIHSASGAKRRKPAKPRARRTPRKASGSIGLL
jgi:hypothetical protein